MTSQPTTAAHVLENDTVVCADCYSEITRDRTRLHDPGFHLHNRRHAVTGERCRECDAALDDSPALPRVTITIAQRLAYQPRPHMVGKEPTKRAARVFFESTDRLGQRRTRTDQRLYSGTPMQAEMAAAVDALNSLKVPCQVLIRTGNRALVERTEAARNLNRDGWRMLARAEARHRVTFELHEPAKNRASIPDAE